MGLLDTILGRSKPVRPDLDRLFALPSAVISLEAGAGFVPTGLGSVCFAGVEGGGFARIRDDVRELLDADNERADAPVEFSQDAYGYTWLLARHPPDDPPPSSMTCTRSTHCSRTAASGPSCCARWSVSAMPNSGLWRWSTSTSEAPSIRSRRCRAREKRDSQRELQVKAVIGDDLRIESDLSRWFPVWGAPGL